MFRCCLNEVLFKCYLGLSILIHVDDVMSLSDVRSSDK